MVRSCILCKNRNPPFFEIPSKREIRDKWLQFLDNNGITTVSDYSVICKKHFSESCFKQASKICRLIEGSVPTIRNTHPDAPIHQDLPCDMPSSTLELPASSPEMTALQNQCNALALELKQANQNYKRCFTKLQKIEKEVNKYSKTIRSIEKIYDDAENCDEKAGILLDIIHNYGKKVPRWSELTVRMCTVWKFCSPKGYQFCRKNLIKLPSKATIARFLGQFNGANELIKERLSAELANFRHPSEKICSLLIDDMSIKEKMHYSRSEDLIYGLDTCSTGSIGEKPKIANKLLCFVIHGLSTRYTIPVGYYFHASLQAAEYYLLTMNVLKFVTDCGFIILRIVTDNFSSNVALFKKFGGGEFKNYIDHPFLPQLPLFFSFDFCHAIKNARNLFLSRTMHSSGGIISSEYLKQLYGLQKNLPVKPVRYLTKKHLYPSNFEKMNVLRAIQVFSPTVTAALKLLKENGYEEFQDVDATVQFMEHMYYFFQIHNVSSRRHYIHALDSSIAPYVDICDERLHWLNVIFPNYIEDIQSTSVTAGFEGLTLETAHALSFTSKSTYLCICFLLQQIGFYYVLTRSFSSDAVEATFSHIRLKGGFNDTTDARAAAYALRQILRCGIIKTSDSANTAQNISFISSSHLSPSTSKIHVNREDKFNFNFLPTNLKYKIYSLAKSSTPEADIYSASVAFLSGYIIKKLQDKIQCDTCITPLMSIATPGPLLRLISLQDRGGLMYPNTTFVGLIKTVADIIQDLMPYLAYEKACKQILEILQPFLIKNPLLTCSQHQYELSILIIIITAKPIITNICLQETDSVKRRLLSNKPGSRKVLKVQ